WKALGKKWHSLDKGFAKGETPAWPLEVAERAVKLLETIAGPDSIILSAADGFEVKPRGANHAWAEVKTKEAGSLRITLAGPESAFDESGFSNLEMKGPIDHSETQNTTITLNLTSLKHIRSRKLRTFLKSHLAHTLG
ncbi:excinuclease ABC subunit A, partial [bacterium]|nr:excinuclease ABC subunit A [bacterium]